LRLAIKTEQWLIIDGNHWLAFYKEKGLQEIEVRVFTSWSKEYGELTETLMYKIARSEHVLNQAFAPYSKY
jgi:hypothetical protein